MGALWDSAVSHDIDRVSDRAPQCFEYGVKIGVICNFSPLARVLMGALIGELVPGKHQSRSCPEQFHLPFGYLPLNLSFWN